MQLCCLLEYIEGLRIKQNKVPSINKHCFVFFPLVVTAELYLLVYEFAIASETMLRGLSPFAWHGYGAYEVLHYRYS